MIGISLRGISQFLLDPWGAMQDMRQLTPKLQTACLALIAASLVMVVIDLSYGPFAWPQSVEPGGKRSRPWLLIALVEILRAFGVASILLIGVRHLLRVPITVSDAVWMTVPYAIALVLFELAQMAAVLVRVFGVNPYGWTFMFGFTGCILVLVISVRALAPARDWLSTLPVVGVAYWAGTFYTPIVLVITAIYLFVRRLSR